MTIFKPKFIKRKKESLKNSKLICLFAHYNARGEIAQYVLTYLDHLANIGFDIFFISNSAVNKESRSLMEKKYSNCKIFERENSGGDFGAWQWAIQNNLIPPGTENLLLTNDSVFGPLFDLQPIFDQMQNGDSDFWGLTDSFHHSWHIQSYFICFSKKVFFSEAFQSVFRQSFSSKNKLQIIRRGEILLTQNLVKAGFKAKVFIPYKKLDDEADSNFTYNPTHFFWNTLITEYRFPFIKREFILQNPEGLQSLDKLFFITRDESNYDTENIKSYIVENNSFQLSPYKNIETSALCHIFYPHSFYYFLSRLAVLKKYNTRFFFNLSDTISADPDFIDILERIFPGSIIIHTPDKGRDIGGKLAALDILIKTEIKSKYTLIIHDKFSPHTPTGSKWRDDLFKIIDPGRITSIIDMFEENPDIGVIATKKFISNEYNPDIDGFDCTSSAILKKFINEYNLTLNNFNFVAGAIFWIRSGILKKFFLKTPPLSVRMKLEDGNTMDLTRGTAIHSWERLLSMISNDQGFKIKGI